jgi:hypothetical protein
MRDGFEVDDVAVNGYAMRRIDRPGAKPIDFAVVDFGGHLTVTNPSDFIAAPCSWIRSCEKLRLWLVTCSPSFTRQLIESVALCSETHLWTVRG